MSDEIKNRQVSYLYFPLRRKLKKGGTMPAKKYQIFVSSTKEDLSSERHAVYERNYP